MNFPDRRLSPFSAARFARGSFQASRPPQRFPQQELYLAVDTSHFVARPMTELLVCIGFEAKQERFTLSHYSLLPLQHRSRDLRGVGKVTDARLDDFDAGHGQPPVQAGNPHRSRVLAEQLEHNCLIWLDHEQAEETKEDVEYHQNDKQPDRLYELAFGHRCRAVYESVDAQQQHNNRSRPAK